MSAASFGFRWLDLLEKEFDKTFVDIDLIIGDVEDLEDSEWLPTVREKMKTLSSCFIQLAHKSQTIFQANAKLEAELLNFKHEYCHTEAQLSIHERESKEMLMQLHSARLEIHRRTSFSDDDVEMTDKIQKQMEQEIEIERKNQMALLVPHKELKFLQKENDFLKAELLSLQSELSGTKLTAKYLNKELAGRIQQLQLLSRDLSIEIPDRVWHQLESEIHLHRHKTFVGICRSTASKQRQTEDPYSPSLTQPQADQINVVRPITIPRNSSDNLGMSITGGREHGIPILISELHAGQPAYDCGQLYVGDAILSVNGVCLKGKSHDQCVELISRLQGDVQLDVIFVQPETDDPVDEDLPTYRFSGKNSIEYTEEIDDMGNNIREDDRSASQYTLVSSEGSIENTGEKVENHVRSTEEFVEKTSENENMALNDLPEIHNGPETSSEGSVHTLSSDVPNDYSQNLNGVSMENNIDQS